MVFAGSLARGVPLVALLVSGCATDQRIPEDGEGGKIICDSYIIMEMCVRDLVNDGQVDMIYFSDTYEIFMYRKGMREAVSSVMPFHRCAVVLSPNMQATTNKILDRENLTLSQELSLTRELISNYMAAKPEIEACNAKFDGEEGVDTPEEEFYVDEAEWED